ncbi:hypothetical protein BGX27_000708 [Mortierella sp. AM989]|nr:hypothetical protein BGX27_000708 [Mortierella sp. AM989]
MLSFIPRQTLRVARTCQIQSVGNFRYYSSSSNDDSNNKTGSGNDAESSAILDIISGDASSANSTRSGSSGSDNSLKRDMILDTLSRATERQQKLVSQQSSLLSKFGSSGRALMGEPQTCTHNLHIHASMNNTILTLTDSHGDPITTQSAGSAGFKKSARSGPEAGYQAMAKLVEKVEEKNVQIQTLHVLMKGFGPGRDSAFKAIRAMTTWDIKRISDTTPIPFNGCRPPKPRRL